MTDIHSHILPGVDDGARDMESAVEMAAVAAESGISVMAATPHCGLFGRGENFWGQDFIRRLEAFQKALLLEKIPLSIVPGMEIFGTEEVPRLLAEGKMIGLNFSDYPLVEFPFYDYGGEATEILEEICAMGMRPVVAHPERYDYVQREPKIMNLWADMGCLFQINKGSLLGRFGKNEKYLAMELVERNFAFAVASDAHSPEERTPRMKEVRDLLRIDFSKETARRLLSENPKKLLKNEKIRTEEPFWF